MTDPFNLPSYGARSRLINIQTLEHRKNTAKEVFVFKILAGEMDAPYLLASLDINVPAYTFHSSDFFRLPHRFYKYDVKGPIRSMMNVFNSKSDTFMALVLSPR